MKVDLELKPLHWTDNQGSLDCDGEWILVYGLRCLDEGSGIKSYDAQCYLVDSCPKLMEKHGLIRDVRCGGGSFESIEEVQKACNAHFRELMLKAFLQPA